MPTLKIYPPRQLPEQSLSEQEFQDWINELEIYLGAVDDMAHFMTDGRYHQWQSEERNPLRLQILHAQDPDRLASNARNRDNLMEELLTKRRIQLKQFLGLVAKCASKNMYATIVRHATSLQWVYTRLRQDYDIQQKGVHFLNIIDIKWNPETKTPAGFYNEYRTVIMNNIARQNEVMHWNDNNVQAQDEVIGASYEDLILLNVLTRPVIRIILARRLSQIFRRLHYVLHWIYWLGSDCSLYNVYILFPVGVGDSRFSDTNQFFPY